MAESRAHYKEFADLPAYAGPGLPTPARDAIAALANFASDDPDRSLDPAVESSLPLGCTFKTLYPHGSAYWSRTAAILTLENEMPRKFFLKLTRSEVGRTNLVGEYTSIQTINDAVPGFSPVPIAVGTYATDPDVHFYLASYVDMTDDVPGVDQLPQKVAELHSKAMSPNGKFGFTVSTNMGAAVQSNKWTSSWEECFSRLITVQFEFEQDVHGRNQEMVDMQQTILDKVIPRLLRPLETEGNAIQPRFVHGDLWDGNTSVDAATDQPLIFDASGMYAHNEYELGAWNIPRHKIHRAYIKQYQRHFPPSVPEEDFEDRLILYRYRFNMTSSGCYLDNLRFRELAIEDMKYLTSKFKDGYQGAARKKGEESSANQIQ